MNIVEMNNTLHAPLLILHLLRNITVYDTGLKPQDQTAALDNIDWLENAIAGTNEEKLNLVEDERDKYEQCDITLDSIIQTDPDGCMLQLAIEGNSQRAVEALLEKNAKINGHCGGKTALHLAVLQNNTKLLDLMLSKNPHVDEHNNEGLTPAQLAATGGFAEAVELLAQNGRKLPLDKGKNNLVHLAAAAGHVSVIKTLKKMYPIKFNNPKKKSLIDAQNKNKESPLHLAATNGHLDVVTELQLLGANLEAEDRLKNTALHKAAEAGHKDIVEFLLQQPNVQIDKANKRGDTPLLVALKTGKRDILETLTRNGANLFITGEMGNTVLHYAAQGDLDDYVSYFLGPYFKLSVDVPNDNSNTPLHKAAVANSTKAAKVLLKRGAFINAINSPMRHTPLHLAAFANAKEVASILIQEHANKFAKDRDGYTPADLASKQGHFELAYTILK